MRTLHALRPALRCSEVELRDQIQTINRFDGRALVALSVFAIASSLLVSVLLSGPLVFEMLAEIFAQTGLPAEQQAQMIRVALVWQAASGVIVWWLMCLFFYTGGTVAMRFSRLGEDRAVIDLVDLGPLKPFAEWALGRVVAVIVLAALLFFAIFVFPNPDQPIGIAGADVPGIVSSGIVIPVAALAALLWPVRGVHRLIQREKAAELERIRAEMREARQPNSTVREGRLADLIAYEGRIESIQPWTFDRSTLLRFGLVVGAGMSMVIAALVERLVDAVLS